MDAKDSASEEDTKFSYNPLKSGLQPEIRIITILPDSFGAALQLILSHFSIVLLDTHQDDTCLEEAGMAFEALSYTWGTQGLSVSVSLDDQRFMVSPNLESILRHLRYEGRPRRIWIDAICINQTDGEEKGSQLPLMHSIYAKASNVIVWLGDASDDSHLAVSYIREVHAPVEAGKEDLVSDEIPMSKWPLSYLATAPMDHPQLERIMAFYKLLMRPWWYRAWIVQEMALARRIVVQCGKNTVDFAHLRVALLVTWKIHPAFILYADIVESARTEDSMLSDVWPADGINNALNLEYCRRMMLQKSPTFDQQGVTQANDISWPLWFTRARLCREPQDRTFSILGMAGKDFRDELRCVDISSTKEKLQVERHYAYTASAEHNRNTVRAFVAATNSVDIISHSQHSFWLEEGSSWAPDWSQPERAAVFHLNGQALQHPIPFQRGDADMPSQSRVLHIRGRIIGKIESNRLEINHLVAHGMELNATGLPVAAKVDTITPFTRRRRWWIFKKEYENGELFHQALADLPATSHLWKCHLELFLMEFEKIYRTCTMPLETRLAKDQSACRVLTGAQFQGLEPFFSLLEYLLMSRTICSMEDSRLLVAPDVAHAGDSVAVLAGCTNAVVLRRNENNESFRLLGDAHVCGVTDEETSRDGLMVISIN